MGVGVWRDSNILTEMGIVDDIKSIRLGKNSHVKLVWSLCDIGREDETRKHNLNKVLTTFMQVG